MIFPQQRLLLMQSPFLQMLYISWWKWYIVAFYLLCNIILIALQSNDHFTYMANSSTLNFMLQVMTGNPFCLNCRFPCSWDFCLDSDSIIVNDASMKPLLVAREHSDLDATWLKEQISMQPGYDLWQKLRHHVLSGLNIQGYWDFAVHIVEQFAYTCCPLVRLLSSSHLSISLLLFQGRKLSKECVVHNGLCFGMTWFNEIKESLALLEEYKNDPDIAEWLMLDKWMLGRSKGLQCRLQIHHETVKASSSSL